MKIVYTAAFLIMLYSSAFGNTMNDALILTIHQLNFSTSNFIQPCSKTYTFDFEGIVDKEVSIVITDYILKKIGICTVDFDMNAKKISVSVTDKVDYDSVKWLVRKAFHDYAIHEDLDSKN